MKEIATVGLDLAKNVFQIHAVDAAGAVVIRRQLRRALMPLFFLRLLPCLVGMEACAGAHFWALELAKFGHEVFMFSSPLWMVRARPWSVFAVPCAPSTCHL